MDLLEDLFSRQAALNDAVFEKRSIRGEDGRILSMADLFAKARSGEATPPSDTARWIAGYLKALLEEGRELSDEIPWKWWSKENLDMDAIRVEIVDMLHFWISLSLASGMDAAEVHRLYVLKNEVNHRRQDQGYDASSKTGRDDLHVR
ncbi:MAG TPA: dUTPase [Fibrobacteria bacterium]|nr:dUTPase [Fibrobacteria bacterium]HOX53762.1 dUTPase [Fibrobacteria bacterium]